MTPGASVVARHNGVVESVDAARIVVKIDENEVDETGTGVDIYNLIKFARSNQNTCLNQKPIVRVGRPRQARRHYCRRPFYGMG
jgi:DNA-directed RNA polymerase subunit beta